MCSIGLYACTCHISETYCVFLHPCWKQVDAHFSIILFSGTFSVLCCSAERELVMIGWTFAKFLKLLVGLLYMWFINKEKRSHMLMWRLVWIWHVSKFYLPLQIQSTFYWHLPWDFGRAEMMIVMIGWKKNHFFSVLSHSSSRTYTTNIGKIHFASLKNCGKWSMAIYHIL